MKDATKARKPVHRTAFPFAQPKASQLQQPQHDAAVQLLINTLKPLGNYRSNLPKTNKGRNKKRKRRAKSAEEAKPNDDATEVMEATRSGPPRSQEDVLVGFNAVTRHLEMLSISSSRTDRGKNAEQKPRHIAAVFLLREVDDLIYSHLPTLCHTASLAHKEQPATRLVLLDPSVEKSVATALAQSPNVSVLAILEANEEDAISKGLIDYVRKEVVAVEVPWLRQAMEAQWLGTKVDMQ